MSGEESSKTFFGSIQWPLGTGGKPIDRTRNTEESRLHNSCIEIEGSINNEPQIKTDGAADPKGMQNFSSETKTQRAPYFSWIWSPSNAKDEVNLFKANNGSIFEDPKFLDSRPQDPKSSVQPTASKADHLGENESTPLLKTRTKSHQKCDIEVQNEVTWYRYFSSYLWNNNEETYEDSNDPDLYRSAKIAIESSNDISHYAVRFPSGGIVGKSEFELAVSDTKTESYPVKNSNIKKPISSNEFQENYLKPTKNKEQEVSSVSNKKNQNTENNLKSLKHKTHDYPLVVPLIEENYRIITHKTKLRLIGEHVLFHGNTSEKHLYRLDEARINNRTKNIKNVVVLGMHGFLPLKLVKTLIGESTGSSTKFVEEATKAVKSWFQSNGKENNIHYNIEAISLDGKGMIKERVDKLYKLLENWVELINNCDVLFIVSHSLGSVISTHLLAKMLEPSSIYNLRKKRIVFLSMCGAFQGPHLGLDSKLIIRAFTSHENEIIKELFDLQRPGSSQYMHLAESMKYLISHDVKITLAASVDDQFIPLISALGLQFNHPNIFRTLYVQPESEAPLFLANLLRVNLILLNLGYRDFRLIYDLNDKLNFSSSGGGHSRAFSDEGVYLIAIKHALECTNLVHNRELEILSEARNYAIRNSGSITYNLPWDLRSIIGHLIELKNIDAFSYIKLLANNYNSWEPSQKKWRDLQLYFETFEDIDVDEIYV